MFLGNENIPHS